jgi:hypothetical protein
MKQHGMVNRVASHAVAAEKHHDARDLLLNVDIRPSMLRINAVQRVVPDTTQAKTQVR